MKRVSWLGAFHEAWKRLAAVGFLTTPTLAILTLMGSAWAQNPPIQATPMPPLQQQWRQGAPVPIPQATIPPSWVPGSGASRGAPGSTVQGPTGQNPGLQGPNVQRPIGQGPNGQGPSVQGPSVQGASVQGLSVPGLSVQGPINQGPTGSLSGPVPIVQSPPLQGQGVQGPPSIQGPGGQAPGPQEPVIHGQALPATAPALVTPPATVERPSSWVPARVLTLQALDKVNAQSSELKIKVGQSATFGSLTIAVKSCMIRPPDQPADAAAYLDVTDSHPDSPSFDGWILQDEPSVSMLQHPIYDLRVTGCA